MKMGFRLIRRNLRGGKFYCVDTLTGKRASLGTRSEDEATQIVQAKNQALRQPVLNLSIAKAHLAGSESGIATRTWQNAFDAIKDTKLGETKIRWAREKAFDLIPGKIIVETHAEMFLAVLKTGAVSTNVHLRKLHNICLGMNWLPWPIIPKRQWPEVRFKEKRAISRSRSINPSLRGKQTTNAALSTKSPGTLELRNPTSPSLKRRVWIGKTRSSATSERKPGR